MRPDTTEKTFKPAWWLPEGHSQTLFRKFAGAEPVEHIRNRVELEDGDFIDVDWLWASRAYAGGQRALVFLLHGLCGSSSSSYMLSLQRHLSLSLIHISEPTRPLYISYAVFCLNDPDIGEPQLGCIVPQINDNASVGLQQSGCPSASRQ